MSKSSFTGTKLGVLPAWSVKHLGALLFTCICLAAALHAQQPGQGAIVVSSDEWLFSNGNTGITCCQDTLFAMNIARFLVPLGGTILIQDRNGFGLGDTGLKAALSGMGAHVIEYNACNNPFLIGFGPIDAIFVNGLPCSPLNVSALISYVEGGGHVFLEVGTGCCGGAAGEAAAWNPFLNPFGLTLSHHLQRNL